MSRERERGGVTGDWWSLRQVQERLGWTRRATLDHLTMLHAKHGGLIFRRPRQRSKYRILAPRLMELMKGRFEAPPTAEDIERLHARVDQVERLAEKALREIAKARVVPS